MNLGATTLWSELKRPTELFPASQKPLFGNSPQGFPTQPCIIEHLSPTFYPLSSTQVHLPFWLWQMPKHQFLPPKVRASTKYMCFNAHCAGTYFATVRMIVAMGVTKAKIVVLVSPQPSSSALNSSATVTFEYTHCQIVNA